jgi:heme-degrading monooxygenase HmoA
MYARSTTIAGKPAEVERGIVYIRARVLPAVMGMDGFIGLSMLADRHSGRCIVTSAWEDTTALRQSAPQVKAMRARASDILGGPAVIDEWTIAVLHRMHPAPENACARVTWTQGKPERLDGMTDAFGVSMVPRLEDIPGFCSVSVLVEPATGRAVTAVTYDSRDAMHAAIEHATELRQEFTRHTGAQVVEVATFDLVVAELRVPEIV